MKIRLESTLEDFDVTELQKQKFEAEDGASSFEMSENSFSIQNDDGAGEAGGVTDLANLS